MRARYLILSSSTDEDCRSALLFIPYRPRVIQVFPWGQRLLHYGWQCKLKTFLYVNMVSLTTKPFTFCPVSLGPSTYFMLHLLTDKTLLNSRIPILILFSYIFTWQKILLPEAAKLRFRIEYRDAPAPSSENGKTFRSIMIKRWALIESPLITFLTILTFSKRVVKFTFLARNVDGASRDTDYFTAFWFLQANV